MTPTYAQLRAMQAIRRRGLAPSNTTQPLLRRLTDRGLIRRDASRWALTEAGAEALDAAEVAQACRDLGARLARVLG